MQILNKTDNFFAEQICLQFNYAISASKFPASFKFTNITLFIKIVLKTKKMIIDQKHSPKCWQDIWNLICGQLSNHFNNIQWKFQCGLPKSFATQNCLLLMIGKWKKAVNWKKVFGTILTDLSKALVRIYHDLSAAKLHAYGLSFPALK